MNADRTKVFANRTWLITATHKPVIRMAKDDNAIKPYIVRDEGGTRPFTLSRHKSDLAARRAIAKYRRMIGL